MSDEKNKDDETVGCAVLVLIVGALLTCIAVGCLFGSGYGWLAAGVGLMAFAWTGLQ